MPQSLTRSRSTLLAIVALWAVFYGSFTSRYPALLDDADSVHAEVAREMLLRHDYVTLYANGIRYLEKGPLLYWAMALSMRMAQIVGQTSPGALAVAARVPMALTVLALALLTEGFARHAFASARAGLYASLILLSSPGIFLFTRILLPDAMLCLWLVLGLFAFWRAEQEECPRRPPCWTFACACALGVLTKGLIGVVFPIAIVTPYLLLTRGAVGAFKRVRELHPLSSAAIFMAIAAPWHLLAALANPTQGLPGSLSFTLHPVAGHGHWSVPLPSDGNIHGWAWFYFVNEQVLRFLNLRVPRDYDTVPLWLFWGLCLIWLMPWSAFAFHAVSRAIRTAWQNRRDHPRASPFLLLSVWAAVPLLFFSVSTRQEYYVLPALPALILLVAGSLADASRWRNQAEVQPNLTRGTTQVSSAVGHGVQDLMRALNAGRSAQRMSAWLLGLGALFAVAAVSLLLRVGPPAAGADLAALLQQNPGDYAMSMGHFLDLNAQALGLFRLPLAIAAASLLLGPLAAYLLRRRGKPHAAVLSLSAGAFGFLLAAHLGLQTFAPVLSSAQLANSIAAQIARAPGELPPLIVIHQEYEFGSTLGFYLQRPAYIELSGRAVTINPVHILTESEYGGTRDYGRSSNLWYGSFFADAPTIFETKGTLAAKWNGPQRIFLWQDLAGQPSGPPTLSGPVYIVAKSGGKEILSNQPNR